MNTVDPKCCERMNLLSLFTETASLRTIEVSTYILKMLERWI